MSTTPDYHRTDTAALYRLQVHARDVLARLGRFDPAYHVDERERIDAATVRCMEILAEIEEELSWRDLVTQGLDYYAY